MSVLRLFRRVVHLPRWRIFGSDVSAFVLNLCFVWFAETEVGVQSSARLGPVFNAAPWGALQEHDGPSGNILAGTQVASQRNRIRISVLVLPITLYKCTSWAYFHLPSLLFSNLPLPFPSQVHRHSGWWGTPPIPHSQSPSIHLEPFSFVFSFRLSWPTVFHHVSPFPPGAS